MLQIGPEMFESEIFAHKFSNYLNVTYLQLIQLLLLFLLGFLLVYILLMLNYLWLLLLSLLFLVLLLFRLFFILGGFFPSQSIDEVHIHANFMVSYYCQVLHNFIPMIFIYVQIPIIWNHDKIGIEWTDFFKYYCLE